MLTQVGKYQILEKIGVGGFGSVYKGRDPFIKRLVAIKTCQSDEEELKKRFFREAEFAGNLHHRHITTIYDFGVTDDGIPYIVQEFLTGEDLDKAIKRKDPLSIGRKVKILFDVCDGLAYAHASGIIHRDIKPSNIRVLEDGTVKIMDFGIAKSMVSQSTLTQTGITLGTASYLAPEQIRGDAIDPRTDIFSLGVLAYELLTYQKPFTGDHISTVLYKILNEGPPRPHEIDPAVPPALDSLSMRMLEKVRENRPASCAEMKVELQAIADSLTGSNRSVEGGPPSQTGLGAAGRLDSEPTRATPSGGIANPPPGAGQGQTSASRAIPTPEPTAPRVVSVPTPSRPVVRPVPTATSSVADVRIRQEEPLLSGSMGSEESGGGALKIFLGSLFVVLALGGGVFYFLVLRPQQRKALDPQPTAAPSTTTTASTAASPGAVEPTATPEPTTAPAPTAVPTAVPVVPVVKATQPLPKATPTTAPAVTGEFGSARFFSNYKAQLTVDGVKRGETQPPLLIPNLRVGRHTAVFETEGLPPYRQAFDITGGSTVDDVKVVFPSRGLLQVKINYEAREADFFLDGNAIGKAPTRARWFRAGQHQLQVVLPGYKTWTQSIEIPDGDVKNVTVNMEREPTTPDPGAPKQ